MRPTLLLGLLAACAAAPPAPPTAAAPTEGASGLRAVVVSVDKME